MKASAQTGITIIGHVGFHLWLLRGQRNACSARLLIRGLDGDTRAAFGAASINYAAATNCFHADSESVGFFAAGDGGLVRAFHDCSRLVSSISRI